MFELPIAKDDKSDSMPWQHFRTPTVIKFSLFATCHVGYGFALVEEWSSLAVLTFVIFHHEIAFWVISINGQAGLPSAFAGVTEEKVESMSAMGLQTENVVAKIHNVRFVLRSWHILKSFNPLGLFLRQWLLVRAHCRSRDKRAR